MTTRRGRGDACGRRRRRENLGEDVFRGIRANRGQEREAALTHRASREGPTRTFEVGRGTRPKPNPTDADCTGLRKEIRRNAALTHRATAERADAEAGKRPRGRGRRGDAEARDGAERKPPEDKPKDTRKGDRERS